MRRAKGVATIGETALSDAARDQLLLAIAKARRWMEDVAADRDTFEAIASRNDCGERHVRFLAPLALVSPAIIDAIESGRAPGHLTITSLARSLPLRWADQDARILG